MRPGQKVTLHLIVAQPGGAIKTEPVMSPMGPLSSGGEYAVVCAPERQLGENFRATDQPKIATCPKCLKSDAWAKAMKLQLEGEGVEDEDIPVMTAAWLEKKLNIK